MSNKKIKRINLAGEMYDIAVDNINKVEGLPEKLNSFSSSTYYPNDSGEIKTKFRVAAKDYTATTRYYKLITLPINDTNNYASALLEGRIGGWANNTITDINAVIWNNGIPGMSILSLASGTVTSATNIWNNCDLMLVVNSSSSATDTTTATLYVKCYSYFIFDLDIEVFHHDITIDYDGTYLTTAPMGTLAAKASDNINKLELINGKVTVGTKTLLAGSWNSSTGVLTLNTK